MSDAVTLTIDGKEVTVPKGTLIIRAAEQLGIQIPRFCDHPLLEPLGACRQCYVEIEGQHKLFTSCTTTVAQDMAVLTQDTSEEARRAQVANLEFLLLNHPLDCPICDRGGECPLQDQTLAFGPGESRYVEAKRLYEKPIPLSPLVDLDRERCVLCARCTRFCDQISGDRFIELFDRGAGERVSIAAGEDFASPFSGNTIQICPVGALTATTYRFVARPFDLQSADTVCPHCASGCNIKLDTRRGRVVRHLARDNLEVNDAWLCDKGRFAFRFPDSESRVTVPLLRGRGLEPVSFAEAFESITGTARGGRVAFLTGGRLADEDCYALSKLARTVFGTNDLDHRRRFHAGDAEARAAAAPMGVTYRDVERAKAILVAGLDAEQELPILHLRIRKAARRGARVFVLHPRRTCLWDVAEEILCAPGSEAGLLSRLSEASGTEAGLGEVAAALRDAGESGVVIAGPRLADVPFATDAATRLAAETKTRFAYATRRANDRGALRAGVHPGLLPGGRSLEADAASPGIDEVEAVWGSLADRHPGRNSGEILEAAARRDIEVLFLIGADPIGDFPDASLARRALGNVRLTVVQDLELGGLEPYADVFLPAAAFLEKSGHFTTWEGRGQRLDPVRGPPGNARPDWQIFAELAEAAGSSLGFSSLGELQEELGALLAPREEAAAEAPAGRAAEEEGPGGLMLFTYPLLVDAGRLSEGADELRAAMSAEPFLEINPADAEGLGLAEGDRAVVRTDAGEAELPVRVTPHVAEGAVFVPFNQPGFAANTLLSGSFIAPATVTAVAGAVAVADASGGEA